MYMIDDWRFVRLGWWVKAVTNRYFFIVNGMGANGYDYVLGLTKWHGLSFGRSKSSRKNSMR